MQTGAAYFDLGRYAEAEERFRAALERAPDLAEAAHLAGLARCLAGDPGGAIPMLERAARLADAGARPRIEWVLANARLASGDTGASRRTLEALAADPGELGSRARDLLARLPR
jgi:tetratricopeptide (TPR) repeat protein